MAWYSDSAHSVMLRPIFEVNFVYNPHSLPIHKSNRLKIVGIEMSINWGCGERNDSRFLKKTVTLASQDYFYGLEA